eukprot:CAMPEP_0194372732 /NCGR_PEP_ID=MMETSP0174-20130528/21118_1 /TAXON_ID=216777 /ORGANISM="Proboscia alata, Strain PI-D3" /LENGTH=217 /DNA_ID=CAMNT_0039151423 /DNA_START=50 /DNA_END=700 /DNA_ORIENTATION=-
MFTTNQAITCIFATLLNSVTVSRGYVVNTNIISSASITKTTTTATSLYADNRRGFLNSAAIFGAATLIASGGNPSPALAADLDICPAKANNCVRTVFKSPKGTSKKDAAKTLRDAITAYPQEGQNEIDGGGWKIINDDLDGSSGLVSLEFSSSGKGKFAKFFNGGKPFVDDTLLQIVDGSDAANVQVRSQSRVGDSDFGVNAKRVDYLFAGLSAKGW